MALSSSATESLLRAVDIIASSKIGETAYDQTIICTIVDNSEIEKRGFYTVTDGKVRFKAYTDVTTYEVGDQIRVTVPNGDFNSKKYVDGPHITDDDSSAPMSYVSPLDSFLSMAELTNLVPVEKGQLKANFLDVTNPNGLPIWSINLNDQIYADLQNNGIYDAIGLSADFRCLLGNYNMKDGSYGLRLDVKVLLNNKTNYIVKSFYLDSEEMFGNPYNYVAPSTQHKMFNTVSLGTITEMTLYLYQNNNFVYYDVDNNVLENIPVEDEWYNIFVDNVKISFGTNIANVEDNTLKIYTLSNEGFNYTNPTDQTNTKTIGMLWYNKNELNQYLGFSDGIVDLKDGQIQPYDEIKYLTEQKKNIRLASQLGKDNVPKDAAGLELAALIDEAFIAIEEAKVLISTDLINTLKNCEKKLEERLPEGFVIIDDNYVGPLQNGDNAFIKTFESDLNQKKEYLQAMLAFVAKVQRVQNHTDYWNDTEAAEKPSEASGTETLASMMDSKLNALQNIHNNTISKFEVLVAQEEFKQFKNSCDTFIQSASDILSLISAKFSEIKNKAYITDVELDEYGNIVREEQTTLEEALNWYTTSKYTAPYIPPEDTDHANRYSIYWYRYVPGYVDPNPDYAFAGAEWERMIPESTRYETSSNKETSKLMPYNLGLPSSYVEKDEIYYWNKQPNGKEGMLQIYLEPKMHQEKFKVVLFYNHEKYESEPIVFTNLDDITSIYADKTSALSIEHVEGSGNNYQKLYSPNNFLYNQTEAKKSRAVRAVYNGVLGTTEKVLITEPHAHIYWYIPRENSMLDVDYEFMVKPESEGGAGFTTDYVPTYRFNKDVLKRLWLWNKWYKERYGKSFDFFWDKPYGSDKSQRPQSYTFDEWLNFFNPTMQIDDSSEFEQLGLSNAFRGFKKVGDYLSLTDDFSTQSLSRKNGTLEKWGGKWLPFPFTMKLPVLKKKEDGTEILDTSTEGVETEIIEEVKDEHAREGFAYFYKQVENLEDLKFFYKIKSHYSNKGMNDCLSCLVETNNETFEASLNVSFGTQGSLGADYNFIIDPTDKQSAVRADKPLQVDIELYDYDNKQIPIYEYSFSENSNAYLTTSASDKSYLQWIGPSYDLHLKENENNQIIGGEITHVSGTNSETGSILQLTASFNNSVESRPEGAGSDYKKTRLSNITTFYSVPYATGDFYIEGATSVIYDNNGGNPDYYKNPYKIFQSNGDPLGNVTWEIKYYSYENGTFSDASSEKSFCENYLPVLNQHNVLTPCATYLDKGNSSKEYYAFIQCRNNASGQSNVIWSQPIIVRKNRYVANMENSYDSSLAINLNSGTIISSLMNAFRRGGNSGKSLQGFMVGDLQTPDGAKNLGFYGFNSGQQAFGFGVNGTAIIGKDNGPQIRFIEDDTDDTNSTSSKREYKILSSSFVENSQGLKIDLEDGIIDIFGTKKEGSGRTSLTTSRPTASIGGNSLFPNYTKQQGYTNLNSSNQKKSAHIYINAASSKERQDGTVGYVKPEVGGFPKWWFSSSWGKDSSSGSTGSSGFWGDFMSGIGGRSRATNDVMAAADTTTTNTDALFKIEVPSVNNSNDYSSLILISDDSCLIQSNNYKTGTYTWSASGGGTTNGGGEGMRIDLSYGTIDAYKLKISSSNILINSSGDKDPLFVVRTSEGNNLMYVEDSGSEFFLQSSEYDASQKKGMKIDVKGGSIESYNFSLHGESGSGTYAGSYIHMDSGGDGSEPIFEFYLKQAASGNQAARDLSLLKISPSEFILNSPSYNEQEKTGLSLNLTEGSIKSYNFSLRGESDAGYIYITSNDETNGKPLIELSSKVDSTDVKLLTVSPDTFELTSSQFDNGTGIYLDVYNGNMEVKNNDISLLSIYNTGENKSFTITSPDFEASTASGINLDILNGSLEVKNQNKTLMAITDQAFTLTSSTFLDNNNNKNSGMQIDVLNGSIEVRKSADLTLLYINPETSDQYPNGAFFLKSHDWKDNSQGMQIDLMKKQIIAYKSSNQKLVIDADSNSGFPLQIGKPLGDGTEDLAFRVDWDGVIYLNDSQFIINNDSGETDEDGNQVTGGTLTYSNIKATKTDDEKNGNIVAEGYVRAHGGMYASSFYAKNGSTNTKISDKDGNLSGKSLSIKDGTTEMISLTGSNGKITAKAFEANGFRIPSDSTNIVFEKGVTFEKTITFGEINATSLNVKNGNTNNIILNGSNGKITAKAFEANGFRIPSDNNNIVFEKGVTFEKLATFDNYISMKANNITKTFQPKSFATAQIQDAGGNLITVLVADSSYNYILGSN